MNSKWPIFNPRKGHGRKRKPLNHNDRWLDCDFPQSQVIPPEPVEKMVNMPGVGIVPAKTAGYTAPGTYQSTYHYTPLPAHPKHTGQPVKVGEYTVYAGGTRDLTTADLNGFDVLIPLLQDLPNLKFGANYRILAAPLADYGGVPEDWERFLRKQVIPLLAKGKKVLAFCMGSHGRTGCFLASLISILETKEETPDPIAAARERHCYKAVESLAQARAIFALRGENLPKKWDEEFSHSYTVPVGGSLYDYGRGYKGYDGYGGYSSYQRQPVQAACNNPQTTVEVTPVQQQEDDFRYFDLREELPPPAAEAPANPHEDVRLYRDRKWDF